MSLYLPNPKNLLIEKKIRTLVSGVEKGGPHWRTHNLAKTALSLFSGAGGMDIGILDAGFEVRACIELDEHCCNTLRHAATKEHRATRVVEEDIRQVNALSLMKSLKLKEGRLDLLFGGPPCQPFSQIGKQEYLDDQRGLLLFEIVRFARAFKPKYILMEQVKGVLTAKGSNQQKGEVWSLLTQKLKAIGYQSHWNVLMAADFGVPQLRERVFLIATRNNTKFIFPRATHAPNKTDSGSLSLFSDQKPYITVGPVLDGLGKPCLKGEEPNFPNHIDATPAGDRKRIVGVPEGEYLAKQLHLPAEQRGRLTKKDTTKYLRLSRSGQSKTLRCGEVFFHPTEDRYLTPREYMRIHGFSDDYELLGPVRGRSGSVKNLDQHRQVANSVPPKLVKLLGKEIMRNLCLNSLKSSALRKRTTRKKPRSTGETVGAHL